MDVKINGNVSGIRDTVLAEMEGLYELRMRRDEFASRELVEALARYTAMLGREISVYIGRDGRVADVSIGDSGKVTMPEMRLVRNADRLCGVRCIHTHPGGSGRLSGVDLGTLRSMRLDSMAAIGVSAEGVPVNMFAAFLGEADEAGERAVLIAGPLRPMRLPQQVLIDEIYAADERFKAASREAEGARPERAILVGIESAEGYDTIAELGELAKTAGLKVVGKSVQRRRDVDNATYIGSGKAEELSLAVSEFEADLLIFDDELSAVQIRNLEDMTGAGVMDRTALILAIFAQRASSREGKLQVELAQLKYRLPRVRGKGIELSRQGAGILARGPGETKLEIDKRRIRSRIAELSAELKEIESQRSLRRERRSAAKEDVVALVGYTNAGKSTLLNALTGAGVLAEDKLFATLDPVVRQAVLPGGTEALFSDTVGFINKLPHDLIAAFRSTLEEVLEARLILHVADCTSDYYEEQVRVVEDVLSSLGAGDTPRINVYNKIDALPQTPPARPGAYLISAKTGAGVEELLREVERRLNAARTRVSLTVPYDKYEAAALIRAEGRVLAETHEADGAHIEAELDEKSVWKLKKILGEI